MKVQTIAETQIIELSTTLIGLSALNCYHGYLDSSHVLNEELINEDFNEGYNYFNDNYYFYHFQNSEYMKELVSQLDVIESPIIDALSEFNIDIDSINVVNYSSPKEYNFSTDSFNLDFEVKDKSTFVSQLLDNLDNDTFKTWLKENYTSRSGFWSFIETDFSTFKSELLEFNNAYIAVAVEFLMQDFINDNDYYYNLGLEDIEMHYSDFVDYDILDAAIVDIKKDVFDIDNFVGIDTEMAKVLISKYSKQC